MPPRGLPGSPFRRHFRLSFLPGGQHAFVFPLLGRSQNFQHIFLAWLRRLPAPTWTEVAPERLPEASGRRFRTLPGLIFALRGSVLGPPGSIFSTFRKYFSHAPRKALLPQPQTKIKTFSFLFCSFPPPLLLPLLLSGPGPAECAKRWNNKNYE